MSFSFGYHSLVDLDFKDRMYQARWIFGQLFGQAAWKEGDLKHECICCPRPPPDNGYRRWLLISTSTSRRSFLQNLVCLNLSSGFPFILLVFCICLLHAQVLCYWVGIPKLRPCRCPLHQALDASPSQWLRVEGHRWCRRLVLISMQTSMFSQMDRYDLITRCIQSPIPHPGSSAYPCVADDAEWSPKQPQPAGSWEVCSSRRQWEVATEQKHEDQQWGGWCWPGAGSSSKFVCCKRLEQVGMCNAGHGGHLRAGRRSSQGPNQFWN